MVSGIDYAQLAQTALTLIAANGQSVTFSRNSRTPGNVAQPWRGPGSEPTVSLSLIAVVIPNTEMDDKEAMRRGDATAYVAAGGNTPLAFSDGALLSEADNMVDSAGTIWHVHGVDILNPGGTNIMYVCTLAH